MTGRRMLIGCAAVIAAAGLTAAAQNPQVFRATTALVTVDVAVLDGNKLVRGLTPKDFEIEDEGVRQQIEMVDVESLPVDLTLVVDTSGSVRSMIEDIRLYVKDAASVLRADDRVRLITFAGEVRDVFGLQPATIDIPVDRIVVNGATSINDAIIASLMRTRRGDRRQLIVAFTDCIETNSAMDMSALELVAERSDSVLHIFRVKDAFRNPQPFLYLNTRGYLLTRVDQDLEGLGAAARSTGGWLSDVAVRPELPAKLRETLEDFRTSYVLRYRPAGVAQQGWHRISVKVPNRSYAVRARTGYFWGSLK